MQTSPGKLLILDLDETLIFATEEKLERDANFRIGQYYVYKRPFVTEFLEFCFDNFNVAVWTTSTTNYAAEIVKAIFTEKQEPLFIWSRDRCTFSYDPELQEHLYVKKMYKLRRKKYDLNSVIVIDDSPNVWSNSYGNLVRISRFEGDEDDKELKILPRYLETLIDVPNIRKVEKRNWRSKISF